jgi:hypothetical protein
MDRPGPFCASDTVHALFVCTDSYMSCKSVGK